MADKTPLSGPEPTEETQPEAAHPESDAGQAQTFDADYVEKLRGEAAKWRTQFRDTQKQLEDIQAQLTQQQKEREQAKTAELKEQGKYKEAFDEATATITRLEAQAAEAKQMKATVEKYQAALTGLLESQRDGMPESITTLLDKLDPVEQLEWLAKNRQAVVPPPEAPEAPRKPSLAGFNPAGTPGNAENDAQRVARLRKQSGQMVTPFG